MLPPGSAQITECLFHLPSSWEKQLGAFDTWTHLGCPVLGWSGFVLESSVDPVTCRRVNLRSFIPPSLTLSGEGCCSPVPLCLLRGSREMKWQESQHGWGHGKQMLGPRSSHKAAFHFLGKSHAGPPWRNGRPQDSCFLSAGLGGQGWLTQAPPFFKPRWPQVGRVCVRGSYRGSSWNFPAAILTATGAAVCLTVVLMWGHFESTQTQL